MTDLSYTLKADVRRANPNTLGQGEAGNLKYVSASKSVTARSDGDTLKFLRLPSNARISGQSELHNDDLASTGAPTIDIGVGSVDSNITSDPDAINNGLDAATAGTNKVIADHANYGKRLWELAGLSEDPKGELDVYVSFVDAATNVTGDVTLEVYYTLD
jgi:hypothetical protein